MTTHQKVNRKRTARMQIIYDMVFQDNCLRSGMLLSKKVLLIMLCLPGMIVASHAGVRIEEPIVIPRHVEAGTNSPNGLSSPSSQPNVNEEKIDGPKNIPNVTQDSQGKSDVVETATGSNTTVVPDADSAESGSLEPEFAFASSNNSYAPVSREISPSFNNRVTDNQPQGEKEEMYVRMRMAVERIASEYGNPTFAQFFTNDKVRAQVIRNRLQLLQSYELLQTEIAALEQKKAVVAKAVDAASRQRMEQIKLEIQVLERRKQSVAREVEQAVAQQKAALSAEISVLEKRKRELEKETEQSVLQQKAIIQAETALLRQEKNSLEIDVSSQKNELKTLKEESSLLRERIIKAQKALSLAETGG